LQSAGDGGAVMVETGAVFDCTDCSFSDNSASATGGAIRNDGSLRLVRPVFSGISCPGKPAEYRYD